MWFVFAEQQKYYYLFINENTQCQILMTEWPRYLGSEPRHFTDLTPGEEDRRRLGRESPVFVQLPRRQIVLYVVYFVLLLEWGL